MAIDKLELQNQLVLIAHHLEDSIKGIQDKDDDYVKKSLLDIAESLSKIADELPGQLVRDTEIERIADEIEEL